VQQITKIDLVCNCPRPNLCALRAKLTGVRTTLECASTAAVEAPNFLRREMPFTGSPRRQWPIAFPGWEAEGLGGLQIDDFVGN
jgi:hypothetical protein